MPRYRTLIPATLAIAAALFASGSAMADTLDATGHLEVTGKWTAKTRGQALTPPMGWNSWNAYRTEVDEEKVLGAAQALVDSGLAKLGYNYVNIDDGWWLKRRTSDGRMLIRTQIFPSAKLKGDSSFKPFTDRIHAMGLKAGIYSDMGRNACSQRFDLHSPNLPEGTAAEREVGLYGHVDQDIDLYFRQWGFDYIKVDACGLNYYGPDEPVVKSEGYRAFAPIIDQSAINRTDIPQVRALYQSVSDALAKSNPDNDYILSLCNWGTADVRQWGHDVGNMWRTSQDITPEWTRMLHTFDSAATRALYAHPGAWNDPDMLFVGHGDFDENHLTEARSHFSLWAIINAPLIIGYDLRKAPKSLLDIWGNADIIRLNQDKSGHQAVLEYMSDDVEIFVKTLSNGDKAVAIFNRGLAPADVALTAAHLKMTGTIALTDLWSKATQSFSGETLLKVAPRETLVFEARGARQLADGLYLSEIPGNIHVAEDGVIVPQPDPMVHRMISPWDSSRGGGSRAAYTGWGGAQADSTPYDQNLQVAGHPFATGIGILAGSRMEVKNDGFTRFETQAGVDDTTQNLKDAVIFQVYGDGRLLTETKSVYGEPAKTLNADISGVKVVELVARADNRTSDLPLIVTWGDAALKK
ncbi:NPCBM/NEW2 domain-containing protein [Asticcacaulis taihuensis]|uniref:Alpha-galactosidase n=1 Tax=Asticcacaulis taihuensis TaxID=260084 RepID=A0A1G4SUW6_9CAUL|nr:NPCBM/NEW2 domain-containing protein [Asticcacaulis taihuensis]SCW72866.1 NPCBM/NEW2 domain-containing protein [Asticcacaulis taihuensis]